MKNLAVVQHNLFRGGSPSSQDIVFLHKNFNIQKIISLDEKIGNSIKDICNKLGIKQIIIPINCSNTNTVSNLFEYHINDLFDKSVPTFVHCRHGKDRTGFVIALVRCILDNWSAERAIKEAKKYGFGTGLDFPTEAFFVKLIRYAAQTHDKNNVQDIVEYSRDSNSITRDEQIDPYGYSWAPYAMRDGTYPGANFIDQQVRSPYSTRQDLANEIDGDLEYGFTRIPVDNTIFPQTGYPSEVQQITNSVGPSVLSGGFL